MYLDAAKPRIFSDSQGELNKALPIHDSCFAFVFDPQSSLEREDFGKLTVKDMRGQMKDSALV